MMNPNDLTQLFWDRGGASSPTPVVLIQAYSVCPGVLEVHEAIHKLTDDDPDIPVIHKNGGPQDRTLGDVQPIWVALYMGTGSEKYCVVYEDDVNKVSLPDDFDGYNTQDTE